jgi:predicted HTH domain antitoxin
LRPSAVGVPGRWKTGIQRSAIGKKLEEIEQSDRSTTVRKLLYRAIQEWKLDYYSRLYGDSKLTLARAAREAGVSVWEMMDYARKKKITAQYDLVDFQEDLKMASTRR